MEPSWIYSLDSVSAEYLSLGTCRHHAATTIFLERIAMRVPIHPPFAMIEHLETEWVCHAQNSDLEQAVSKRLFGRAHKAQAPLQTVTAVHSYSKDAPCQQ
jgi:hypothetical protein